MCPRLSPALLLFILSPAIGELLSGSSPPAEFFSPFGLAIMLALYGGGALLVREVKVRWNKGVVSLLFLGAAYGVLEEGVMVASFFNPGWQDLGQLGVYGRSLGVNWVWAEMLTIYHAVFSVAIPVVIVELLWSERRREPWLGRRAFVGVLFLFTCVVAGGSFLFAEMTGYAPSPAQYGLALVLAFSLVLLAYVSPASAGRGEIPLGSKGLWALGLAWSALFFLGFWGMPSMVPNWQVGVLLLSIILSTPALLLARYSWEGCEREAFSLAAGLLTFLIILAPLQELDQSRTDVTTGMGLVGLAFAAILLLFKRRIWAKTAFS